MPVPGHRSQRGFTLIEVLVAITILLVGVLGVVAMVDGASAVTARTKAREGATNVSRSVIEVGRAVPYRDLSDTSLYAALESRPGLDDALPLSGYQIRSRGFTYTVSLEVCAMDDPKDDLGEDDGSVTFCPESETASAGNVKDRNPDDYRRIAVTLTWKRGSSEETAKQTSIVPNPIGGLGPSVIDLDPDLSGTPFTVTSGSSVDFDLSTSVSADTVNWLVSGASQGEASQTDLAGRTWQFTWNLDTPTSFPDCTYVVGAEAFDEDGRSGAPKSVTIVVNRSRPGAPPDFDGGRNGNGSMVDLEWQKGPDCDVLGYQVFREENGSGTWTQITCLDQDQPEYQEGLSCIDDAAPAGVTLRYQVRAVDTLPAGGLGSGSLAGPITIAEGNNKPEAPANLTACLGGTSGCVESNGDDASDGVTVLTWDAPPSPDSDGDDIYFYRIYRDGTAYANRVGAYFHGPGLLAWADPDTPDASHTYVVTAVDRRFAESDPSAAVVDFP